MQDPPTLRRVRMQVPTSRWRDPDFIVFFMVGAAIVAIVSLIGGGYEAFQYVAAQSDPASRIGVCKPTSSDYCVVVTQVEVIGSNGDQVKVQSIDGGQGMALTRIGGAQASEFPRQDRVWLEWYQGDNIALSNRTTGALMKLENYPEPALRYWVPEVSIGSFCLAAWIGLWLWRRHLYATLVVSSKP